MTEKRSQTQNTERSPAAEASPRPSEAEENRGLQPAGCAPPDASDASSVDGAPEAEGASMPGAPVSGADDRWTSFHERSYEAGKAVRHISIEGAAAAAAAAHELTRASQVAATNAVEVSRAVAGTARSQAEAWAKRIADERDPLLEAGRDAVDRLRAEAVELGSGTSAVAGAMALEGAKRTAQAAEDLSARTRELFEQRALLAHDARDGLRSAAEKGLSVASMIGSAGKGLIHHGANAMEIAAAAKDSWTAETSASLEELRRKAAPHVEAALTAGTDAAAGAWATSSEIAEDAARAASTAHEKGMLLGEVVAEGARAMSELASKKARALAESPELEEATRVARDRASALAERSKEALAAQARVAAEEAHEAAKKASTWVATEGAAQSRDVLDEVVSAANAAASSVGEHGGRLGRSAAVAAESAARSLGSMAEGAGDLVSEHGADLARGLADRGSMVAKDVKAVGAEVLKDLTDDDSEVRKKAQAAAAGLAEKGKDLAEGLSGGAKAFWRGLKGE